MGFFKFRKAYAIVAALSIIVSQSGVQGSIAYAAPKTVKTISVKIGGKNVTKKTFKMTKGKTAKLKVLVKPAASKKKVTFQSSSQKIVKVTKNGKLSAKKTGNAKITIKVKGNDGKNKKTWVKIKVTKKNTNVATKAPGTEEKGTPEPAVTDIPEESKVPEGTNVPEGSLIPKESKVPGESKAPEEGNTPEPGSTPDVSNTPEVTSTPGGFVYPGILPGGGSSGSTTTPEKTTIPSQAPGTSQTPSVSNTPGTSNTPGASQTPETDTTAAPEESQTPAPTESPVPTGIPVTNETKTINNSSDLLKELAKMPLPAQIIYNSQEKEEIELPELNASNTTLVVNAPNATINNNTVFKDIQIDAIAADTWFEKAIKNKIKVNAKKSHICIATGAALDKLDVAGDAKGVNIENEGIVKGISVSVNVNITITGSNRTKIPFEVQESAKGALINTTIPLVVDASADITLQLRLGAEQMTSVSLLNSLINLTLQGLGVIPVTNKENNKTENIVASVPDGFDIESGNVSPAAITGIVTKASADGNILLENAYLYMLPYKDNSLSENTDTLIAEAEAAGNCIKTVTQADGKYEIKELKRGNYLLVVKADGLLDYKQTVILNREVYYNPDIEMLDVQDENAKGNVEGTLVDAVTGNVNVPLLLELRKGAGNISGEPYASIESDEYTGMYRFDNIPVGTYTIYVKDTAQNKKYSNATFTVTILPDTTVTRNMTISRVDTNNEGQLQFILRWLPEPVSGASVVSSDLDSHLTGPLSKGTGMFHTYFSNRQYYENGEQYADLDRDDTDYEGPETTTVRKETDGIYHFYVHDFANSSQYNTKLSTSKPVVDVYVGDVLIGSFSVPEGVGNIWDVCTYNTVTDTLTPVNEIYYHSSSVDTIGNDNTAIDYLKELLNNNNWEDYNIAELLKEAEELINKPCSYTQASIIAARLSAIREPLSIEGISFTGMYGDIYNGVEDGIPVIGLTGTEASLPDDIEIFFTSCAISYKLTDSDKKGYDKKLIISNKAAGITKDYYIIYSQYIPDMIPYGIEDEDNYISNMEISSKYTANGKEDIINVFGTAEALTGPALKFYNEDVTSVYKELTDNEYYTGQFTVSYKENAKVYFVIYKKTSSGTELIEPANIFKNDSTINNNITSITEEDTSLLLPDNKEEPKA